MNAGWCRPALRVVGDAVLETFRALGAGLHTEAVNRLAPDRRGSRNRPRAWTLGLQLPPRFGERHLTQRLHATERFAEPQAKASALKKNDQPDFHPTGRMNSDLISRPGTDIQVAALGYPEKITPSRVGILQQNSLD